MRNISRWAKLHPRTSRLLIVLSYLLLTVIGFFLGDMIRNSGWEFSSAYAYILFFAILVISVAYPLRKLRPGNVSPSAYVYRKACDLTLMVCTFLMMIYLGNKPEKFFNYGSLYGSTSTVIIPKDSSAKTYKTAWAFHKSMKDANGNQLKWKERRKILKEQIRSVKKAKDLSKGAKVALIFLSVLLAIGLLYAVAALACNLSCSGSGAAAVFVALAGAAVVAILLVLAIRGILGKKRKKPKPAPETGT